MIKLQSLDSSGTLRIQVKRAAPLMVRIPSGLQAADVTVKGAAALPRLIHGYLYIAAPTHTAFAVTFPLRRQAITLQYKTRRIQTALQGDQMERMENFGEDLTFFDQLP